MNTLEKLMQIFDLKSQERFRLLNEVEDDYIDEREYLLTPENLFYIDEKGFWKKAEDDILLGIIRDEYIVYHLEFHPRLGEKYYTFVSDSMEPIPVTWQDTFLDNMNKKLNVIFKSYEEAAKNRAYVYEKITGRRFVPK